LKVQGFVNDFFFNYFAGNSWIISLKTNLQFLQKTVNNMNGESLIEIDMRKIEGEIAEGKKLGEIKGKREPSNESSRKMPNCLKAALEKT
jgi:hypothetical protein